MELLCKSCSKVLINTQKIVCSMACRNKIYTNKGIKFTDEHKRKIGQANKGNKRPDLAEYNRKNAKSGRDNPHWKETGQAYSTIHLQVVRLWGKPKICEVCDGLKNLQWSNKKHTYKLDRDDWHTLCHWCHEKYDRDMGFRQRQNPL